MTTWSLILAAGSGTRLSSATSGTRKQFLAWQGAPLYWHSAKALASVPAMAGLVFVFPLEELEERRKEISDLSKHNDLGVNIAIVPGGDSRRASSRKGLEAVPPDCDYVLIHDAARPFVTPSLTLRIIKALQNGARTVVPAVPVKDTVRMVGDDGLVTTLDRSRLHAVQTPQGFPRDVLFRAHSRAEKEAWTVTDDASMAERLGETVTLVPGDEANTKITTPEDLTLLAALPPISMVRTGWGYDVHKYGSGRPLKLGGIPIPSGPEVEAHSDGDVLLHALIDALLGCLARGDIGELFPDTDPAFENVSSGVLLNQVLALAEQDGLEIEHVDLTLICQVPRIAPIKGQIKKNIVSLLALDPDQVNIKATTEEGLGFTGQKKGIKAVAVVTGRIAHNG